MGSFRTDALRLLALAALLAAAPLVLPNNYHLTVLIMCCLHAIIAVGLNLLVGHAGQISLGHAEFYGLGATPRPRSRPPWACPFRSVVSTDVVQ